MPSPFVTHTLGYPRIGIHRELKKATEAYWAGQLSAHDLEAEGTRIRKSMWESQRQAGIDWICCNDFSFYDRMLDMSILVDAVPARFRRALLSRLDLMFAMARGLPASEQAPTIHACEMTKWFDTNYHYIVPEIGPATEFRIVDDKPVREFREAHRLGFQSRPALIGPVTYLKLSKPSSPAFAEDGFTPLSRLDDLLAVYADLLRSLSEAGAEWVQMDEPIFSCDLNDAERNALAYAYQRLSKAAPELKIFVANYFGRLEDNLETFCSLPVHALHLDLVRAPQELLPILQRMVSRDTILSLGLVDGRNIWRNDLQASLHLLDQAHQVLPAERIWVAPSCSLQHVPLSLEPETTLDLALRTRLAFAEEKLQEIRLLGDSAAAPISAEVLQQNQNVLSQWVTDVRLNDPEVRTRLSQCRDDDFRRKSSFPERQRLQRERLDLPAFPTTTIGSFPQTEAVRKNRSRWKRHEISTQEYESFLKSEIAHCVQVQEKLGLDMLVHGEFERNDMVEYFGEQLDGFAFTCNGWVQSYGSRYVKPPILFGDVKRQSPMTVPWSEYAQSLTTKPMKGMLTGPITILQWSFVRNDLSRQDVAFQIALALRNEVLDLEQAKLAAIQVDEPALREGLPLRRVDWPEYLHWSVDAFRLATAGVQDHTQVHTHMCYAEFNDIMEAIVAMDADVITMEASRSGNDLLATFARVQYPNEIGPGVYDIHSPAIPGIHKMQDRMVQAMQVLPRQNLWVNPDCGLKTRTWQQVEASLRNMVQAAKALRRATSAITIPHTLSSQTGGTP